MKFSCRLLAIIFLAYSFVLLNSCSKDPLTAPQEKAGGQSSVNAEDSSSGSSGGQATDGTQSEATEKERVIEYNPDDYADVSGYDSARYLLDFSADVAEDGGEAVKTTVSIADGSGQPGTITSQWTNEDQIRVCSSKGEIATYQYNSTTGRFALAAGSTALSAGCTYYAYYPAIICTGAAGSTTSMAVDLSAATLYGGLGQATGTSRAVSLSNCKAPMASCFTGKEASFRNAGHILLVQIYGEETISNFNLSTTGGFLSGTGTLSVTTVGGAPTMAATSATSVLNVPVSPTVTLSKTNPTNFYFIIPGSSTALSNVTFKTTFSQTDPAGETFTPVMTQTLPSEVSITPSANSVKRVRLNAHYFSGGNGSQGNPYKISTTADLEALRTYCSNNSGLNEQTGYKSDIASPRCYFSSNIYYLQTADLDFSSTSYAGTIGSDSRPIYFSYDGNDAASNGRRSISNMTFSDPSNYVGIFGKLSKLPGSSVGGIIKNLTLTRPRITGISTSEQSVTGALVGCLSGGAAVQNCVVNGNGSSEMATVTGQRVGGVIGLVEAGGEIANLYASNLQVSASATSTPYCGGFIGKVVTSTSLAHIYASDGGNLIVNGTGNVGGICGSFADGASATVQMSDTYITNSTITGTGNNVGGTVGRNYSNGTVVARTRSSTEESQASVSNTGGNVSINGVNYVGGMVGYNEGIISGTVANNVVYGGKTGYATTISASESYAGGIAGISVSAESDNRLIHTFVNTVSVTAASGYAGGVVGYLDNHAYDVTASHVTVLAGNSASGTYTDYAGGIAGYTYKNGEIDNKTTAPTTELSGYMSEYSSVEGNNYVGGVIGHQNAALTGTYTSKTGNSGVREVDVLAHGNYAGGVSGRADALIGGNGLSVTGNSEKSTIRAYGQHVGGVAGYSSGAINNTRLRLYSVQGLAADGTTYQDYVGGIVGELSGGSHDGPSSDSGSVCESTIKGNNYVGGICGKQYNSLVVGDDSSGKKITIHTNVSIQGHSYVGGVSGLVESTAEGTNVGINTVKIGKSGTGTCRINGFMYVGGIAGEVNIVHSTTENQSDNYKITDCLLTRDVEVSLTNTSADPAYKVLYGGGVTGQLRGGVIENIVCSAIVSADNGGGIAGIAGIIGDFSNHAIINKCKFHGKAVLTNAGSNQYNVGGIVGRVFSNTNAKQTLILNCIVAPANEDWSAADNQVEINSPNGRLGGIVGLVFDSTILAEAAAPVYIVNCFSIFQKLSFNNADGDGTGGIIGWINHPQTYLIACSSPSYSTFYYLGETPLAENPDWGTYFGKYTELHSVVGILANNRFNTIADVYGRFNISTFNVTGADNYLNFGPQSEVTTTPDPSVNARQFEYKSEKTISYYQKVGGTKVTNLYLSDLMAKGVNYYNNQQKAICYAASAVDWGAYRNLHIGTGDYVFLVPNF